MTAEKVYDEIWERKLSAGIERPVDRWRFTADEFRPAGRLLGSKARVIVGTDIAPQACRAAARHGIRALASSLDGASLPFADASFDAVTCLDVIEHLLDPAHCMREISRVLRPGGRAYVSTVNMRYAKHAFHLVVLGRFPRTSTDTEAYDGGHLHYFTWKNIADLGRAAGLRAAYRVGIIPSSGRLRMLQPLRRWWPVQDFLSAGFLVVFDK
jgi:ubiquinone/menaquinone biosynthesis C-methylase UbiE